MDESGEHLKEILAFDNYLREECALSGLWPIYHHVKLVKLVMPSKQSLNAYTFVG